MVVGEKGGFSFFSARGIESSEGRSNAAAAELHRGAGAAFKAGLFPLFLLLLLLSQTPVSVAEADAAPNSHTIPPLPHHGAKVAIEAKSLLSFKGGHMGSGRIPFLFSATFYIVALA